MKLLTAALALTMATATAMASPLDGFRKDGQIGGYLDMDFAMQNEVNSAIDTSIKYMDRKMDAGLAGVASIAMIPEGDNVIGMGIAKHSSGEALALGYSKVINSKYLVKAGMSYNSENQSTIAAGVGYKF